MDRAKRASASPSTVAGQGAVAPAARRGLAVLLAEDHPGNREIFTTMLRRAGHSVLETPDGRAAVTSFERDADPIDAVLMGVRMPDLDGLEASRAIRARAGLLSSGSADHRAGGAGPGP